MYTILLVIHTIIVLFLILMVLIQRTDSDGMGGLSGGGGNQFLTGRASANLFTRTTAILAAAFMITSLALAVLVSRTKEGSIIDTHVEDVQAPVKKAPAKKEAVKKAPAPSEPDVPKPE